MIGTCECGQVVSDTAERCMRCGAVNRSYRKPADTRQTVCGVLWVLLFIGTVIYFVQFLSDFGQAANIMQQICACSYALCWTVMSYVTIRCLTSALRK
jgi:hypothetical protein